ncbi:winged helix-turn-helix domain-containing protein [Halomicrobium urmianum]|uniref:winged helix-turn-helix domain-containing protein n=1 Tax=Halomicrobium urmianum TaxID=1586233 RepID=UPI001CDA21CB|nr:helix-turn-helix domain-containing protein [Halomicrobium urmianum]
MKQGNTSKQSTEDLLEILADPRRRFVLSYLSRNESATLYDLSSRLAEIEDVDSAADCPDSLTTQLYHVHLPKLEEAGLITYDPVNHDVEPVDLDDERISGLLRLASEADDVSE